MPAQPKDENESWNPQDALELRDFLIRHPKFLKQLKARVPKCTGTTSEERAATGSEAQGARDIIAIIEDDMAVTQTGRRGSDFVDTSTDGL